MTTRRKFLQDTAGASAVLVLGFHLSRKGAVAEPAQAAAAPAEINAWIKIAPDNTVTLIASESEMGQGVLTSLPMILAEELDADWAKVKSEHALTDPRYGQQGTGGSSSIRQDYPSLRKVGAAARAMLLQAAATTWGVPVEELKAAKSVITHAASKRRATYGSLAAKAATIAPPQDPPVKDKKDFTIVGKPTKRLDTRVKVAGTAVFGMDVKVPGMLIAQVAHCPIFGGKLKKFDDGKAKSVPGVRHVVEIPTGVAVVADNFWAAKQGKDLLEVQWDGDTTLTNESIAAKLRELAESPSAVEARKVGDAVAALAASTKKLEAEYEVPYLAHATMEPMNCTADVRADSCEIWAPTQFQTASRATAAQITGLPETKITLHTTFLGGGFGRRAQQDFFVDAVHTSKAVGKPVKVIYTREDDMRAGWYRPVAYNKMAGGLDPDGWPVVWSHKIASPSILSNFGPLRPGQADSQSIEGAANLPYAIPNISVTCAKADFPVTVWFWRSVGSSINAYVTECFLDELAQLGGKDPVDVRRRLLTDHPRHLRVLDLAAVRSGWGTPLPEGRARGVAVHESFGSIVAEVAEVSLRSDGTPRVHRVVCAVDCGQLVNPDTITAQMESGIVYGLSAALYGKIDIQGGKAVQGNFDTYKVLRMNEMPQIETHIIAEGDAMGGIGEPGTPPAFASLVNALFALTGKPIRKLPVVG
ncbi:MAG TPA: xanthine dehydrogenase family protein molybdopterin-binding subunit [Gemmatimonadales bacterium]|jgi:isoquinoline 1-oxidoreductase beta subunit